jgi:hypothetical protein
MGRRGGGGAHWLKRMPHATRGVEPTFQLCTWAGSVGGRTFEPRSPIWYVRPLTLTVPNTLAPPTGVTLYLPPAWPQGSLPHNCEPASGSRAGKRGKTDVVSGVAHITGAEPGALHGLKRYESFTAPGTAWMFMVQYSLGSTALVFGLSQYDLRKPALSSCGLLPVIGFVGILPLLSGCLGSVRQ